MTKITLDTNILPADDLVARAKGIGTDFKVVSVTNRELENTDITVNLMPILETGVCGESANDEVVYAAESIDEPFVIGESPLNQGKLVRKGDSYDFDTILGVVSDGTFPPKHKRNNLSKGHRRQLRDAMIFYAHIREKRDIFVTNDIKGFIGSDDKKKKILEKTYKTKILNRTEFLVWLDAQLRE